MEKSKDQDVFLGIVSRAGKKDENSVFTDKECDVKEFNSPILKDKISESIAELHNSDDFSDVTLIVGNRSFKAHRLVLSANSSYFKGMFSCGMKESREEKVELSNFKPDIFELVLKFLYTGRIDLTVTNVQFVFEMSDLMQINDLVGGCAGYMWENMDEVNCFEVWNFACKMSHAMLAEKAKDFAFRNMYKIIRHKDWFQSLDLSNLLELLENDQLYLKQEDTVCHLALAWVTRHDAQQHLKTILQHIRLTHLDTKFVRYSLMPQSLIKENPECVQLLQDVLNYHLFKEGCPDIKSLYPRLTHNREVNVLIFRKDNLIVTHSLQRSCPSRAIARLPTEFVSDTHKWHTVCTLGSQVYVFKKCQNVCRLWILNTDQNTWRTSDTLMIRRIAFSVVAIQENLYLLGGLSTTDDTSIDTVEELNTTTLKLKQVGKMSKALYHMASVAYKGDIVAFGGCAKPVHSSLPTHCDVQRFSIVRNYTCWNEKQVPTFERRLQAVVYNDKAILCGNRQCFVYDLENNMASILSRHPINVLSDCFLSNGKVFLLGVHLAKDERVNVMVYKPARAIEDPQKPWTSIKRFNDDNSMGLCAVVELQTTFVNWIIPSDEKKD